MIAAIVNTICVLAGSGAGLLFKSRLNQKHLEAVFSAIGVFTIVLGMGSALKSADTLCCIVCLVIGTLIGEALDIEGRIDSVGEKLKSRFAGSGESGSFTQGFVAASLLFCVGSMTVMGSLEAGINKNYTIIFSKSVMDLITSLLLTTTLGAGVLFSAASVLVVQGGLTLCAQFIAPYLSDALTLEMSAIGGVLLIAIGINMLFKKGLHSANMLPAMFLPIIYLPIAALF